MSEVTALKELNAALAASLRDAHAQVNIVTDQLEDRHAAMLTMNLQLEGAIMNECRAVSLAGLHKEMSNQLRHDNAELAEQRDGFVERCSLLGFERRRKSLVQECMHCWRARTSGGGASQPSRWLPWSTFASRHPALTSTQGSTGTVREKRRDHTLQEQM